MITILILISLIAFEWLTRYVKVKYGIQKSISQSYYELKEDGLGKWFTIALWAFALPICLVAAWNDIHLLMFLAGGLICLVAASPAFNDNKKEHIAHMIGAYGGIGLGLLSLIFEYQMGWYVIIAILIGINAIFVLYHDKPKIRFVKNYIWRGEKVAFYIILGGLLLHNILWNLF